MATTLPPSVVTSSRGLLQEECGLPRVRTSDVFKLNAFKLIKKSDYDFNKSPPLGNIIQVRRYGLKDTQKMIQG